MVALRLRLRPRVLHPAPQGTHKRAWLIPPTTSHTRMAPFQRNRSNSHSRGGRPHQQHAHHHPHAHAYQQPQHHQHQQQYGQQRAPAADDEYDGADDGEGSVASQYEHAFESVMPSAKRYEYNLKTVRRHDPHCLYLLHEFSYLIMHKKVFNDGVAAYDKVGIEGTTFIVRRSAAPEYQIVCLNRYGVGNVVKPVSGDDKVLRGTDVVVQWRCELLDEVFGFWSNDARERMELQLALERLIKCLKEGRPYAPDLSFVSCAAWAEDFGLQQARESLLQGLIGDTNDTAPPAQNGRVRSATPTNVFREPEDEEPQAGSSAAGLSALDSLFARISVAGSAAPVASPPPVAPSAFSHQPARAPAAPRASAKAKEKERKGRELLDQLLAAAPTAPTPPPPAPEHRARMTSPQAPQPQVLNGDVLQRLLGFRSTPQVEEPGPPAEVAEEPEGARTPVVHHPVPQRMIQPPAPTATLTVTLNGVDRAAVVDAAADMLSRRKDPVITQAHANGVLDKNTFGQRLVELIHTDRQFMIDLHQEYLRRV
ncbi:hypothetical protein AURDEDRAFT_179841 [Auricularia subglabra TFB-10046 SS5]|nr:hypothetical protein AURDEDRAFT_179841 [Auricularia subglabra TFB-10046 SS5]